MKVHGTFTIGGWNIEENKYEVLAQGTKQYTYGNRGWAQAVRRVKELRGRIERTHAGTHVNILCSFSGHRGGY